MSDRPGPEHDTAHRHGPDHDLPAGLRPPPRPRWVWWLLITIAVAVLGFLGFHLLMGGGHGPMNHMNGTNHSLPAPVQSSLGGDAA